VSRLLGERAAPRRGGEVRRRARIGVESTGAAARGGTTTWFAISTRAVLRQRRNVVR
jgi:hypothetical protein